VLVVADEPPVEGQDAEGLLDDPAPGLGTKPRSAGLRSTTCTSMPLVAPWATTWLLNPWSTSAVRTVPPCAATLSSRAIPAVLSCAEAARTTTAITSPRTSTARPRLRPGTFLAGSFPVVPAGTEKWGSSRQTAAKALQALEDDGLIRRYPGVGYYVLSPGRWRPSHERGRPYVQAPGTHQASAGCGQAVATILEPVLKEIERKLDALSAKTDTVISELAATLARSDEVIRQNDTRTAQDGG